MNMWRNLWDFLGEMAHAVIVALDPGEEWER
jgi:hypothetical protein